jgi:hypothetical protein
MELIMVNSLHSLISLGMKVDALYHLTLTLNIVMLLE